MLSQAAGRIRRASNVERCVASNGPQQVARVEGGYRSDAFVHGCDIRRYRTCISVDLLLLLLLRVNFEVEEAKAVIGLLRVVPLVRASES